MGELKSLHLGQSYNYLGVDFLDFLRLGEEAIHALAESRRRRRRRSPTNEPNAQPAAATAMK